MSGEDSTPGIVIAICNYQARGAKGLKYRLFAVGQTAETSSKKRARMKVEVKSRASKASVRARASKVRLLEENEVSDSKQDIPAVNVRRTTRTRRTIKIEEEEE